MSNNNGAKGKVCRYCMKVWDRQGKRFAQTYDFTSWVEDGYKPIVCEECQSARAGEKHTLRKQGKVDQGIKVVQPPSKEQLDREYRELREIIRLGPEHRWANGFDSYGILSDD